MVRSPPERSLLPLSVGSTVAQTGAGTTPSRCSKSSRHKPAGWTTVSQPERLPEFSANLIEAAGLTGWIWVQRGSGRVSAEPLASLERPDGPVKSNRPYGPAVNMIMGRVYTNAQSWWSYERAR